ncbi:ZZ-type zinc finger-containing protein 3 [Fukomys damarensis]|uniref:ZZ-type zinc finger-containing protein 3 n=1 Tax=Fukomys damarensis TaxID=885580 RepID=A0A091CZD7_FUKDA|nr:ZZ-type zinc finger-containing protein 3 [Fukomys damarensis]
MPSSRRATEGVNLGHTSVMQVLNSLLDLPLVHLDIHRELKRYVFDVLLTQCYQRLLQTIAVLEAQRSQAVQDLESLGKHQREALRNPIGFVEKLQKKADIGLPYPQRVVQLPEIVWDQYTSSLGNFEREFKNRKRHTRRVKLVFDKVGLPARPKSPVDPKKDGESLSYSVLPLSDGPEGSHSRPQMIRGRLCDDTKPETFNQLWTVEEQKKLEQLLLKYPPEEVESRRWQKIADELGNRTAKQVASRVQKYFIKLTKAGIPVPGRTPNLYIYSKKSSTSRRQHPLNKHLFKPSTFMTSHEPPVYMDEDDDRPCCHSHGGAAAEEASDEEIIPIMYRNLPEYKELLQFKKLKKQKLQQMKVRQCTWTRTTTGPAATATGAPRPRRRRQSKVDCFDHCGNAEQKARAEIGCVLCAGASVNICKPGEGELPWPRRADDEESEADVAVQRQGGRVAVSESRSRTLDPGICMVKPSSTSQHCCCIKKFSTSISDEEIIPIMYRNLPEYKELLQFKKLKKQKLQQMQAESGFVQHMGFKCDNCGMEPIQGVRWHCQDCPPEMSLDFCDSCSDCRHETDIHKEDHQLEPVYRSETFLDRDYCVSQGTSYNYLDPNYFPANR